MRVRIDTCDSCGNEIPQRDPLLIVKVFDQADRRSPMDAGDLCESCFDQIAPMMFAARDKVKEKPDEKT